MPTIVEGYRVSEGWSPLIPDSQQPKRKRCCGDRFGLKPATYRMKREWAKLRYAKAAEVAPQRMD